MLIYFAITKDCVLLGRNLRLARLCFNRRSHHLVERLLYIWIMALLRTMRTHLLK